MVWSGMVLIIRKKREREKEREEKQRGRAGGLYLVEYVCLSFFCLV